MPLLQQEGIFKCRPKTWDIYEAESGAVAVSFSFAVLEELDGDKWASWAEYDEHVFYGSWWIIKKDGTINDGAVEQLAKSLGWDGNLNSIVGAPPDKVVQVTVKKDTYNNKTTYKGAWMNPEDHEGGGISIEPARQKELQSRFGSLLRAAASAVAPAKPAAPPKAAPGPKPAPKAAPKPKAPQPAEEEPHRPDAPADNPCICKECLPFVALICMGLTSMLALVA